MPPAVSQSPAGSESAGTPSSGRHDRALAIAVAWSGPSLGGAREERVSRAVGRLAPGARQERLTHGSTLVVVTGTYVTELVSLRPEGFVLPLSRTRCHDDGRHVNGAEFGAADDPQSLAVRMLPPFAALVRQPGSAEVLAVTDRHGLQHVYHVSGDGWAAVSNSALLLAEVFQASADLMAQATYGLLGHLLDQQSPFSGVVKLPPGCAAVIRDGTLALRPAPLARWDAPTPSGSVRHGAQLVRDAVAACLTAAPAAGLELSGGFDSRLVLASIPPELRPGRRAVTIGPTDGEDVVIARELARREGLAHEWVDTSALTRLDPVAAVDLVAAAARARDYAGNGLAFATLDWVEDRLGPAPRLTGQNGELARGFFYPLQPPLRRPTSWLVDALLRLRLTANESADLGIFRPEVAAELRDAVRAAVRKSFLRYEEPWLRATDHFYLDQRMHRWVGLDFTAGSQRRPILAPFFDRDFVAWAMSAAPHLKRHDRLFAQVLLDLDPGLAALPLQGRDSPGDYARPTITHSLTGAARTTGKVARKVSSKVRRRGRPALGAADLASLVRTSWQRDRDALAHVRGLDGIDETVVEAYRCGARVASPPTVALLLNLDGASSSLNAALRA